MPRSTIRTVFHLSVVVVLVLGLCLVVACGGDGEGSGDGAPVDETTEPAATATGSGDGGIDAAGLYSASCATCHGADGQGASAPDLRGLGEDDLASVEQQIREGGGGMPAFGERLDDGEIGALAEYVVAFGE